MDQQHLNLIAATIGAIMGALFAFSGFGDSGKVTELSKNPRIRNLLWLVGGAVTVFVSDWKLLSKDPVTPAERGLMAGAYTLSAVLAFALTLGIIVVMIIISVQSRAARATAFQGRWSELVLEYLTHGYPRYRASFEALDKLAAYEGSLSAPALSRLGEALSAVLTTAALDRASPSPGQTAAAIDLALTGMEDTVKLYGVSGLKLRTNYMVKIAHDQLDGLKPLFVDGPETDYEAFLVLRRYRDGQRNPICLPLEKAHRSARNLPGAPESAQAWMTCCINTRKLDFKSGVPAKIRTEVKAFFTKAPYESVMSVPIWSNRDMVGVVNIESNLVDVVDKGPDMIVEIGKALAPFCVVLGELVQRAEV